MLELPELLWNQIEVLAEQLNLSPNELVQLALEDFIAKHQSEVAESPAHLVNQGEIYWLQAAETEIPHPHLVVQDNLFNHSRLQTVIVCALTSNLKRASYPGNVLLEANEGDLPKQSVVEVSKLSSVDKSKLGEYIGILSEARIQQILAGIRFQQNSYFLR